MLSNASPALEADYVANDNARLDRIWLGQYSCSRARNNDISINLGNHTGLLDFNTTSQGEDEDSSS